MARASWAVQSVRRNLYPMTPDGISIIDRAPGVEGLVLAMGICGQGFMMGPGVGKNVTSLIVDGKTCLPEEAHHCFR